MAQVTSYQTAKGKRYRVRYYTPDRRQTDKRGFKTKREAEAWANKVEVHKMDGSYIAPSLGRITIAELAPEWLERKRHTTAPSHYRTLESAWRVHVAPRWGAVPLAETDVVGLEACGLRRCHNGRRSVPVDLGRRLITT